MIAARCWFGPCAESPSYRLAPADSALLRPEACRANLGEILADTLDRYSLDALTVERIPPGSLVDGFREELDGLGLFSEPVQGSSPHVELADAVRRDPANLIGLFQRSGPPVKVEIGLGERGAGGHVGRLELDDPP